MWQDPGSSGAAGVVFVRKDQELPLCLRKTIVVSSKTDGPLPKAGPISKTGGTTMITYLRKGKQYWAAAV